MATKEFYSKTIQQMVYTAVILSRYKFFLEIWLAAKNALGRTPQFEVHIGPVEQDTVAILDWVSKETTLQQQMPKSNAAKANVGYPGESIMYSLHQTQLNACN